MPSPFPGMNPYLEQSAVWPDFHHAYLTYLSETLSELVGEKYFVAICERMCLYDADDEPAFASEPDVAIPFVVSDRAELTNATTTIVAPARATLPASRKRTVRFLQVVDATQRDVVTVMELLTSGTNAMTAPDTGRSGGSCSVHA